MNGFILLFSVVFVGFIIYANISSFVGIPKMRNQERLAYDKMIANLNDATVSEYIVAFNKLQNYFWYNHSGAAMFNNMRFEDKHRQTQGWTYIKNSTTVSESKKQELKTVFNSKGMNIL